MFSIVVCLQPVNQNNDKHIEKTQNEQQRSPIPSMDPPLTIRMPIASSCMYKIQLKTKTDYVKPIKKFLVFGAGAAVTETGFMKAEVLLEKVEREYCIWVENFLFG